MATGKAPQRTGFQWVLRGALLAAVLFGLGVGVDWEKSLVILQDIPMIRLGGILAAYALTHSLRVVRFALLLKTWDLRTVVSVTSLHVFYLRVLPFRSGELAYAFLLRGTHLGTGSDGVAHLTLTRLLDIGVVLLLGGWGVATLEGSPHLMLWGWGMGLSGGLLLLMTGFGLGDFFCWLAARIQRHPALLSGRLRPFSAIAEKLASEAGQSLKTMDSGSTLGCTGLTLLLWFSAFFVMALCMGAVDDSLSLAQLLVGGSLTTVSSFVPIGLVGTFGLLEAGWTVGFVAAGAPLVEAATAGLVYSIMTLIGAITFALLAPLWKRETPNRSK